MTLPFHFIASFYCVIYLSQMMHSYGQGKESSTNLLFLRGACAWVQMATHCTKQSDDVEQQDPLSLAHILQQR